MRGLDNKKGLTARDEGHISRHAVIYFLIRRYTIVHPNMSCTRGALVFYLLACRVRKTLVTTILLTTESY
jgi:hypothetical protein